MNEQQIREDIDFELHAAHDYRREAYGDPCPIHGTLRGGGDCPQCEAASLVDLRGPVSKAFVLGGKAIFTVANPQGEFYTYRVSAPKGGGEVRFVSLLTGPDNTADYTYIGLLKVSSGEVVTTAKSKLPATSRPVKVAQFAINIAFGKYRLPAGYTILHSGRCGRCARVLTVPASVETGFGPECAGKVGL